jgi:hypothetical protein
MNDANKPEGRFIHSIDFDSAKPRVVVSEANRPCAFPGCGNLRGNIEHECWSNVPHPPKEFCHPFVAPEPEAMCAYTGCGAERRHSWHRCLNTCGHRSNGRGHEPKLFCHPFVAPVPEAKCAFPGCGRERNDRWQQCVPVPYPLSCHPFVAPVEPCVYRYPEKGPGVPCEEGPDAHSLLGHDYMPPKPEEPKFSDAAPIAGLSDVTLAAIRKRSQTKNWTAWYLSDNTDLLGEVDRLLADLSQAQADNVQFVALINEQLRDIKAARADLTQAQLIHAHCEEESIEMAALSLHNEEGLSQAQAVIASLREWAGAPHGTEIGPLFWAGIGSAQKRVLAILDEVEK